MNRTRRICIVVGVMVAVAGCRTPTAEVPAEVTLTEFEERALSSLTLTVEEQRSRVANAEDHLATLQNTGADQASIEKATSDLEHRRRVLKAMEDRWTHEREQLIQRRQHTDLPTTPSTHIP